MINAVSRRPALFLVVPFIIGIIIGEYSAISMEPLLYSLTAGIALASVSIFFNRRKTAMVLLSLVVIGLGAGRVRSVDECTPESDVGNFATQAPRPVRLRGVVVEPPVPQLNTSPKRPYLERQSSIRTRFVFRATEIKAGTWIPASGKIQTFIHGELPFEVKYGDRLELFGWINLPENISVPGEFEYKKYLRSIGIKTLLRVQHPDCAKLLKRDAGNPLWGTTYAIRKTILNHFQNTLDQDNAALMSGLILGEKTQMSVDQREAFIRTGTMHLLVVSGLHLMAFFWVIRWLLRRLCVERHKTAILTLIFIILFAMITGARTPVVRAAVIIGIFLLGPLLRRVPEKFNSIAAAALILLIWDPLSLFSAGFQLSFIAVMFVVWLYIPLFYAYLRWKDFPIHLVVETREKFKLAVEMTVVKAFCASFAAWLGTFPLIIFYFNIISPLSPIINIPAILMGMTLLACAPLIMLTALVLPWVAMMATNTLLWYVSALSSRQEIYFYTPDFHWHWPVLYFSSFIAGAVMLRMKINWKWLSIPAAIVLLTFSFEMFYRSSPEQDTITFLGINQADAAVIEFKNGDVILVDCGLQGNHDKIVPFLRHRKIGHIEAIIISHPHSDHIGALPEVLTAFPVGRLYLDMERTPKRLANVIRKICALKDIPIVFPRRGDVITGLGNAEMSVIHPPKDFTSKDHNDMSIAFILKTDLKYRVCFAGDICKEGLHEVLKKKHEPVDILKAPHHGSFRPITPNFAKQLHPKALVINCYDSETAYLPSPKTVSIYRKLGAKIYRTGKLKTIVFILGKELSVKLPCK